MKKVKNSDVELEQVLKLGNSSGGSFYTEDPLRGRIGHNMKAFLLAYCIDLGRKARPNTLRRQWHALKDAGAETREIINAVQRRRAFKLLEKQGYLYRTTAIEDKKKIVIFKFTEKGISLQERFSDESKLERISREATAVDHFDDRTHIISWDIPEALRKKRALFRHFVKRLGFRLLHKSFFIGKVNVAEFIAKAARLLEIDRYIHCGIYQSTLYHGVAVA